MLGYICLHSGQINIDKDNFFQNQKNNWIEKIKNI